MRAFEWASAGDGLALLRIEARAAPEFAVANAALLVTTGGDTERLDPLPGSRVGHQGALQLAFPASVTVIEDPASTFALETAPGDAIELDRPSELGAGSPQPPAPEPDEDEDEDAARLRRSLDRLRQELRSARTLLDQEEQRADEAYRLQVLAEDRMAAAREAENAAIEERARLEAALAESHAETGEERTRAEELAARGSELEEELSGLRADLTEARSAAESAETRATFLGERTAELERELAEAREGFEEQALELRSLIAAAKQEHAAAQAEGNDWRERFEELGREAALLQERVEEAATSERAAKDEAGKVRAELDDTLPQLAEARAAAEAAEARATGSAERVGELEAELAERGTAHEEAAAELREQLDATRRELDDTLPQLAEARAAAEAAEVRAARAAERVEELERQVAELPEQRRRELQDLREVLVTTRQELDAATAEGREWRERFEALGREAAALQERAESAATTEQAKSTEAAELAQQLAETRAAAEDAEARAAGSAERVVELERQVAELPEQRQRELDDLREVLVSTRQELDAALAEGGEWRERFEALGRESAALQERLESATTTENAKADERVRALSAEVAELQGRLDAAQAAAEQAAAGAAEQAERLKIELELVQSSAASVEAAFMRAEAEVAASRTAPPGPPARSRPR